MGKLELFLREGQSLSGRERNVVLANLGTGGRRFADVSAVSGFDDPGDGRGLAVTDADGDGDLDVWLSQRTAPTVRFMENRWGADAGAWVQFELEGVRCARDAIGARVEVAVRGREGVLVRTLRAGDAFQSQSTKRLHFGLGAGGVVERVVVRWPGAWATPERFAGIEAGGVFRLRQGSGTGERVERKPGAVVAREAAGAEGQGDGAIVLPARPVFPELAWRTFDGVEARYSGEGRLLVLLWHPECVLCREELAGLGAGEPGVRVVALVGEGVEIESAARVVRESGFSGEVGVVADAVVERLLVLHRHLFYRPYQLQVPTGFLLDGEGRLAAVFRGGVAPNAVTVLEREAFPFDGDWIERPAWDRPAVLIRDYVRAGMPGEAERVLRRSRGHQTVAGQIGEIARVIGEGFLFAGAFDDAERLLAEALGAAPGSAKAMNNLGALRLRRGDVAGAKGLWRDAVAADAAYGAPRLNLGKQLMKEGATGEATGLLEAFVGLEPGSAEGRQYVAMGYLRMRRWEDAKRELTVLLQLRPGDRAARENLAKVYLQLGDVEGAKRVMRGR